MPKEIEVKIAHQSASVYIWYPHGTQVGHASMHIGQHSELNDTEWYVSWWPNGDNIMMENSDQHTFAQDKSDDGEGGEPHVVYKLFGGNINNMIVEWANIRAKVGSHYDFLKKNCSTIVARVMRAGGHDEQLNVLKAISYAHNLYWTPKDVAQWCNQLRDKGVATKIKDAGCPTKKQSPTSARVLGLR